MKIRELASRLDRLQKRRRFKVIASVAVAVVAAALFGTLLVVALRPDAAKALAASASAAASARPKGSSYLSMGPVAFMKDVVNSMLFTIASKEGIIGVAMPFVIVAALSAVIIWLGLGLSYLGLLAAGFLVAWPLVMFPATSGVGQIVMGAVPLTLAFLVLMQLLRALFSGATPTSAIARNLLSEAVRMKISLVFIVILILFLALIPGLLNEDQPLRYRVQQWLAYGTGIPYMVLALLTVFLSCATVAFEQRDKIIWQTMTKPVAAWRYLLGKWLGVMGLNAVLLAVTAGGAFMFTEYLRHQPARGEMAYQVLESGQVTLGDPAAQTDDRRILENQVLVARVGATADQYILTDARVDRMVTRAIREGGKSEADRAAIRKQFTDQWNAELKKAVETRLEGVRSQNPQYQPTDNDIRKFQQETMAQWQLVYSTVDPGGGREYEFVLTDIARKWKALREKYFEMLRGEVDRRISQDKVSVPSNPKDADALRERMAERVFAEWQQAGRVPPMPELTVRFKINAGTNVPTELYGITFYVAGQEFTHRQVALKSAQLLSIPVHYVDEDGILRLGVFSDAQNPKAFTFPPDGLEILYPVGGYELNFLRVFLVMWIKLGFVAAVAVAAATFLSFPVACLVTLCVLFAAESASFLNQSLHDYYFSKDREGNIDWFAVLIRAIAVPVGWAFELYSELKPTTKLVDGRLIGWASLGKAFGVLGLWSFVAWSIGWAIFRQRELATYSGR